MLKPSTIIGLIFIIASQFNCNNTSISGDCPDGEPSELLDGLESYWVETYLNNCFSLGDTAFQAEPGVFHILEVVNHSRDTIIPATHFADLAVSYEGGTPLKLNDKYHFGASNLRPGQADKIGLVEEYGKEVFPDFFLCDTTKYSSIRKFNYLIFSFRLIEESGDTTPYRINKCIRKSDRFVFYPAGEKPARLTFPDDEGYVPVILLPEDYKRRKENKY